MPRRSVRGRSPSMHYISLQAVASRVLSEARRSRRTRFGAQGLLNMACAHERRNRTCAPRDGECRPTTHQLSPGPRLRSVCTGWFPARQPASKAPHSALHVQHFWGRVIVERARTPHAHGSPDVRNASSGAAGWTALLQGGAGWRHARGRPRQASRRACSLSTDLHLRRGQPTNTSSGPRPASCSSPVKVCHTCGIGSLHAARADLLSSAAYLCSSCTRE